MRIVCFAFNFQLQLSTTVGKLRIVLCQLNKKKTVFLFFAMIARNDRSFCKRTRRLDNAWLGGTYFLYGDSEPAEDDASSR